MKDGKHASDALTRKDKRIAELEAEQDRLRDALRAAYNATGYAQREIIIKALETSNG